jgi:hypothetical protein
LDAYLTLFTKLSQLRFYYVASRDTNFERAKKLFHGTFQRLWNPEAPRGLFDYFRTRRTWDEKNYGKLTEQDVLFMNQGKERFGNPGIENLYQRWRAGEITENTVRSESVKFQMPSQVTFISASVNGQTALFERHPHQPVNVPVKTEASDGYVPLHPILAAHLRSWREQSPHAKDGDFVFPSLRARGSVPLSPSIFVADYLRPAAKKAGVQIEDGQRFGLHNLRHSLSNWLVNKAKVEPKTVQGILRHSKIQTTLDLYTQEDRDETLAAQGEYLTALGGSSSKVQ